MHAALRVQKVFWRLVFSWRLCKAGSGPGKPHTALHPWRTTCRHMCTHVPQAHLDKVIIRASNDVAPRAVKGNAVHGKVVPAQGALVAQLLHILARRQQATGPVRCCRPSCARYNLVVIMLARDGRPIVHL